MKPFLLGITMAFITIGACNEPEVTSNRSTAGSVLGSDSMVNTKVLKNKLSLTQTDSFSLTDTLPTISVASATGRVAGCVDEPKALHVDGLEVSINVPLDCSNDHIILDQVILSFDGFSGKVTLKQDVPMIVSDDFGSMLLKGFTILRVGGTLSKSVQIDIGGKKVDSTITIDSSASACEDITVASDAAHLKLTMIGQFPVSAQNTQSSNLTYNGATAVATKTHALWRAPLPASEATNLYTGKLAWSKNGIEHHCSFTVSATFIGTVTNPDATDAPTTAITTCDPANADYMNWDRLDVDGLIPALCASDECLLVSTTTSSSGSKVITAAVCY